MKEISFEDLNNKTSEMVKKSKDVKYVSSFTPPAEAFFKQKSRNQIDMCTLDTIASIRRDYILASLRDDVMISEEKKDKVSEFLLGSNVPEEEKEIISSHLDSNMKSRVFEEFMSRQIKSNHEFIEDVSIDLKTNQQTSNYKYNPRVNGVPLKSPEGLKYAIKSDSLIQYLQSGNIPSRMLDLVCVEHFLKENDFFDKSWCPDNMKELKTSLEKPEVQNMVSSVYKGLDQQKVEALKKAKPVEHKVDMNPEFKKAILDSVPKNFDKLEQAMYLYITLCQTFSYDDTFYFDENTPTKGDVSNISNYNKDNNNVVCYEFAYMYADFLRSIGVTDIRETEPNGDRFDNKHANLNFLIEDLPIFADSTISAESGDLFNAKMYYDLNGFRCDSLDEKSQNRFKISLEKVYGYIKENDKSQAALPSIKDYKELNTVERFDLFNKSIESFNESKDENNRSQGRNFTNLEFISFIHKLKSTLFSQDEQKSNLRLAFSPSQCMVKFNDRLKEGYEGENIGYILDLTSRKLYSDNIPVIADRKIDGNKDGHDDSIQDPNTYLSVVQNANQKIRSIVLDKDVNKANRDNIDSERI